jgi:transcriptional regulator with XRE-family HTH domain
MTPEAFKEARLTLRLNQSQAAVLLGYGNAVRISEIEAGRRNPSASVVRLLRAYLAGYRPDDWPA